MKKIILFPLAMMLSGCGIFRQVHKEKETLQTKVSQEVKKDSSGVTINRSVITVREKIDTVLTVPEKTVRQETMLTMDSLVNGITAVKNDLVNVDLILNPVTHMLSAVATLKTRMIPVKIDKQTTTQNNIIQAGNQSVDLKTKDQSAVTHSTADKKPVNLGTWVTIVLIGVLAASLIYFFRTGRKAI